MDNYKLMAQLLMGQGHGEPLPADNTALARGLMAPPRNPARMPAGVENFAMDATVNPLWDVAKGVGALASGAGLGAPEIGPGIMGAMGMMSPGARLPQLLGARAPARIGNIEAAHAANSVKPRPSQASDEFPELDAVFMDIRNRMSTDAPIPPQVAANYNPAPAPTLSGLDVMRQMFMAEQGLSDDIMRSAPFAFRQKIDGDFERWLQANMARSQFKVVE